MRIKNPNLRKNLLLINKNINTVQKEFATIRGDFEFIKEEFDCYEENEKAVRLCNKKKCQFFLNIFDNFFNMGRIQENEVLNLYKFKIINKKSYKEYENILPPELFSKYAILISNFSNKNMENFFIDFFGQPCNKIDISALHYAWNVHYNGKEDFYTLSYIRILNNGDFTEIGPSFDLKLEKEYFNEELFEKSLEKQPKKQRNVEKTVLKDRIGKVFVDKQDFKAIKIKKSLKK
ncbi:hypothetical protein NUSPORA_01696 [Nucleospora cyclopteri]